ncbi:hypothetical protein [Caballeronia sp. M23-90]
MSITSLVTGILSFCTLFADSGWDKDTLAGVFFLFIIPALVFGTLTISQKKAGKGMAIAGIALSVMTAVCLLGISNQTYK